MVVDSALLKPLLSRQDSTCMTLAGVGGFVVPSTMSPGMAGVGGLVVPSTISPGMAGVGGLVVLSMACKGLVQLPVSETGIVSIGSGPAGLRSWPSLTGRSNTTSLSETREFITGTRGVTRGAITPWWTIGPVVPPLAKPAYGLTTGWLLTGSDLGLGGPVFDMPRVARLAMGRGEFTLEVVAVVVMQVFTLGCRIPVGFNPTCGL